MGTHVRVCMHLVDLEGRAQARGRPGQQKFAEVTTILEKAFSFSKEVKKFFPCRNEDND